MTADVYQLRKELDEIRHLPPPPDPPDNDGMEARVTKLETKLDHMVNQLDKIAEQVGQAKWWLIGAVLTIMVTVYGTGVTIQQMTVATFQAAAQAAPQTPVQPAALPPIIINVPGAPQAAASSGR